MAKTTYSHRKEPASSIVNPENKYAKMPPTTATPIKVAIDCETFGAQGITVHPRPDVRHITYMMYFNLRK